MAQWRLARGTPRVGFAAVGIFPTPDLRMLLVRARDGASGVRDVSRQLSLRDRLSAPHLSIPEPGHARAVPGRLRQRRVDVAPRADAPQGVARQRGTPLQDLNAAVN